MMPLHYMRFFFECCHQSSMPSHAPRQVMRCAWLGGAARAFPCLWSDLAGGDATQACGNSTRDCIVERAWATPSMDDNAWSLSCLPHTTGHDKAFET